MQLVENNVHQKWDMHMIYKNHSASYDQNYQTSSRQLGVWGFQSCVLWKGMGAAV